MSSPPYAPRFFESGSEFVISSNYVEDDTRETLITQDTRLLSHLTSKQEIAVSGPRKLVTANLRNLSKAFTELGVSVKAWSFFSGELPGAEMIYQGRQEPEDVFELAVFPSLRELMTARQAVLREHGLMQSVANGIDGEWADFEAIYKAGLREAYLVDDWTLLESELKKRYDYSTDGNGDPGNLLTPDNCLFSSTGLGLNIFAANLPKTSYLWSTGVKHEELREFRGYRTSSLVDLDVHYAQERGSHQSVIGRKAIASEVSLRANMGTRLKLSGL